MKGTANRSGRLSDAELSEFLAALNRYRRKHQLSQYQLTIHTGLWAGYFNGKVWESKRRPRWDTVNRVLDKLHIRPLGEAAAVIDTNGMQFSLLMRRYVAAKAAGFGYWFPAVGAVVSWTLQQLWSPDFPVVMQLFGDIRYGMSPGLLIFPCDGGVEVQMKFLTAHDSLGVEVGVFNNGVPSQSSAVRPLTRGMVRDVMHFVAKIRKTVSRGGPGFHDIGELEKAFDVTNRQDQQEAGFDTGWT